MESISFVGTGQLSLEAPDCDTVSAEQTSSRAIPSARIFVTDTRSFSLSLSTFVLALPVAGMLQGCQTLPRKDAVPVQFTAKAVVVEAPGARYWPEQDIDP